MTRLWPAMLAFALAACANTLALDEQSGAVSVAEALPTPDVEAVSSLANYRLGPTDEISVAVFAAPELEREGVIDNAGNFAMPLVGTVAVAGLTPEGAGQAIAERLRGRFVKNPQVTVSLKKVNSSVVTVDGAVKKPGIYPVMGDMTLQQVIARAEGTTDYANIRRVVVFRQAQGKRMAAMFDLKAIRSGQLEDPRIYGRDVVVIGESSIRRFLRDTQAGLPALGRFLPVL